MSDSISETSATSQSSSPEDDVDPILVAKLKEVLKAAGAADSDDDEGDASENEDEDDVVSQNSDFDDDQMMLIDDKLADIFKQRLGSKQEEEELKKESIALHIKILDLLDVFAKKQSSSPLCVDMVLPLFTIALEKDVALGQLKQRATNILSKTLCRSKDGPIDSLSAEAVFKPMEAVHKMAATKLPTPSLNLCSQVNVYLTRACKVKEVVGSSSRIKDLYVSTFKDFMERKSNNLKPQFLLDVFQKLPILGYTIRKELMSAASGPQDSPKQSYRQLQALEMLRVTLVGMGNTGKDKESLIAFLPSVSSVILDTVSTEKLRIKEIIKVGLDLARLSKKVCDSEAEIESIWPSSKINAAIEALGENNKLPNSVSLQTLLRQLLAITAPSAANKQAKSNGKRRNTEVEVNDNQQETSLKKKKRSSTSSKQ
jgi:DNA polymerase phi